MIPKDTSGLLRETSLSERSRVSAAPSYRQAELPLMAAPVLGRPLQTILMCIYQRYPAKRMRSLVNHVDGIEALSTYRRVLGITLRHLE
jgi:hypothetical protein